MSQPSSRITDVKQQIEQVQAVLTQAHRALEAAEHAEVTVHKAGKKARSGFGRLLVLSVVAGGGYFAYKKFLDSGSSDADAA